MSHTRISGHARASLRPGLERLEDRVNPTAPSVTWELSPSVATTVNDTQTRDTTLTYIADYSVAPTVLPNLKSFTVANGKVLSVTVDPTDNTIYTVNIAPKTGGRAPITVESSVNAGWTTGGTASTPESILFFRNDNQVARASAGSNPKGILPESIHNLNDLVFTFPSNVDVDSVAPSDFHVVGASQLVSNDITISGRTITIDLTVTAIGAAAEVSITLMPNAITDTYGNAFKPATPLRWTVDTVRPTATLTITSGTGKVGETVSVDVAFSEMITNFKKEMVSVTLADGGTTTSIPVRITGSRTGWGFKFRIPSAGTLTITLNTTGTVGTTQVGDRSGNGLNTITPLTLTAFVSG